MTAPPAVSGRAEWWATALVAAAGLGSVVPLLAWVFGLGPFHLWFLAVAVPALVVLVSAAVLAPRLGWRRLQVALMVGTAGGLLGTLLYDLVRVPFVLLGLRVLAPIDSYGVLLLDASTSSGATGFAGWAYHALNGVSFAIAYAAVALGRRWVWGLVWAMVLETATVVTPFALVYGLRSHPELILLAYAAHVPYGWAIGWAAQEGEAFLDRLHEITRRPVLAGLGVIVGGLLIWHWPLTWPAATAQTEIADAEFLPTWVRVAPGQCVPVTNSDDTPYPLAGDITVAPGATEDLCYPDETSRVHRVKLGDRPFSGGFVLVDAEQAP